MSVNAKMTAIADEIRAKTGGTEPLSLDDMAENVPKVYASGQENVKAQVEPINAELEKCLAGTSVEGQTWYDKFWDAYQQNGERTNYDNGFAGNGWNEHNLKPKYDVCPTNAYMMFYHLKSDANVDLVKIEEECGIKFDFSKCTDFMYAFYTNGLVRLGVVDTRSTTGFSQFAAGNGTLHTIEKLILKEDGSQTFYNESWFMPPRLKNITIEGKIGDTLNLKTCNHFTKESVINIINALSDTSTGQTITFMKSFITEPFMFGNVDTSAEWQTLVASKPNWTISLI